MSPWRDWGTSEEAPTPPLFANLGFVPLDRVVGEASSYTLQTVLGVAPRVVDPRTGLALWFAQPLAVLSELGPVKHIDVRMARFFVDTVERHLRRTQQYELPRLSIHDWSTMASYEADARSIYMDYVERNKHQITAAFVVLPRRSALARIGIRTAATVVALVHKQLHFPTDVSKPIRDYGLVADKG